MTPSRFQFLMNRYQLQTLTAAEQEELLAFAQEGDEHVWLDLLHGMMNEENGAAMRLEKEFISKELAAVLSVDSMKIVDEEPAPITSARAVHRVHFLRTTWFRYAAAAVLIVGVITAAIFLSSDRKLNVDNVAKPIKQDALPGRNGAVLTLADGSRVLLDSLGNGVVTTQGKTTVLIRNGQLVYNAAAKENEVLYNTITTPKGRQYQLILPDGSAVWLNAASSITYPTAFAGNDRRVTLTGEAYFEVAKDKSKPFHVKVNDMDVEVLGTHFNINSYADEAEIKTTLLEGSVKVSGNGQIAMLKPGQQANAGNQQLKVVNDADVEMVMAWKNGKFQFNRTPLPEVMRQLSRWYDMDVEYVKDTPNIYFAGRMGRDLNLSQVLKGLNKMEVNFKIEGKKLIVMP